MTSLVVALLAGSVGLIKARLLEQAQVPLKAEPEQFKWQEVGRTSKTRFAHVENGYADRTISFSQAGASRMHHARMALNVHALMCL